MPTTFSVKMSTRRSFQRGGGPSSWRGRSPQGGSPGQRCSRIHPMRWRVLASGKPRAAPATCSIRASRAFSSCQIASALASPVAGSASAAASRAAICAASSASLSSSVYSARSSSASGGLANRRALASGRPSQAWSPGRSSPVPTAPPPSPGASRERWRMPRWTRAASVGGPPPARRRPPERAPCRS